MPEDKEAAIQIEYLKAAEQYADVNSDWILDALRPVLTHAFLNGVLWLADRDLKRISSDY